MKDLNRRTFMKCMAAAATTVVVGQNVSSAFALDGSIIRRLDSADGAYAEQLAFEITSDFKKSPKNFLSQMSGFRKSDINQITGLLFYGYSYENINDLWVILSDLGETSSNLEVKTLSQSMSKSLMLYVESQKQIILSSHPSSTNKSIGKPAITNAINAVDGKKLVSSGGQLFFTSYFAGSSDTAGKNSGRLRQNGSNYLASTKSYTYTEILHYYYDNSSYNNPSVGIVKIN